MMRTPIKDPIAKAPSVAGKASKAWLCDLDAMRKHLREVHGTERPDGTVAVWIVEAPWAHPAWHSYAISLLHLRPIGLETKFYLAGATHEIWVQALHPDHPREPAIAGSGPWLPLSPNNFSAQFIEPSDAAAELRVLKAVAQDLH